MLLRADSLSRFYTADANRLSLHVCMCVYVCVIFSGQCSRAKMQIQEPTSTQSATLNKICARMRPFAGYTYAVNMETRKHAF